MNSQLSLAASKAAAQAAVVQQERLKVAQALEEIKQDLFRMQAHFLVSKQEDDAKRFADMIAFQQQQADAENMAAEPALRLHLVKEEEAFARANFESAGQATGFLSSMRVVQMEGAISVRERRCEQQQDIARIDRRQIVRKLEVINEAEATLVADRLTLQEQEMQLILAAYSSEIKFEEASHSSEVELAGMKRAVRSYSSALQGYGASSRC